MHLGKRLKSLLAERKISNKAVAAALEVTPGAVSNWFSSGTISKENLSRFLRICTG